MDPTEIVLQQLEIARWIVTDSPARTSGGLLAKGVRLAELVIALHESIQQGGCLPRQWQGKGPAHAPLIDSATCESCGVILVDDISIKIGTCTYCRR